MSRKGTMDATRLPARLREFFLTNPDEGLTYADIMAKFNASPKSAQAAVARFASAGLLESVHIVRLRAKGTMR